MTYAHQVKNKTALQRGQSLHQKHTDSQKAQEALKQSGLSTRKAHRLKQAGALALSLS